jgi:radical SAM superfamily enzyme YgiQ (UPF0313 family)
MRGESVFPQLERLLPRVGKPIQYVGGELGTTIKAWDSATVRWALMYPDAYEVGLPNQGVQILYEVLNERDDTLAERTYAVWPDLERLMRSEAVPQFTVDSHRAVGDFDLLGVSFATELGYTNLLTALDLAAIPLLSRDRTGEHPIVVAGGHAAFNPEPIADFIDAAVLGDGEEAVLEITDIVAAWKHEGSPGGRDELLLRLAKTESVYVPRFYDVEYLPDGRIQRVVPNRADVPFRVHKRTTMDLDAWPYPKKPLVPVGGNGARAVRRGDLPWVHSRMPLLPGRHDHSARSRTFDHDSRRNGQAGVGVLGLPRGGPAVAVERRPFRDRRDVQGSGGSI